jgi:hypothetical protein
VVEAHWDLLEVGWEVPESQYFTGGDFGWTGPCGTTYAPNLRLSVQNLTEDAWVEMLRARNTLPPMPWMKINRIHEADTRAIYRYLVSLGPAGEPAPAALQPGQEPSTPYVVLAPPQGCRSRPRITADHLG